MAGSRTHARGFQPIPSLTEKCYSVRLSRRLVPEPSLPTPTVSDPSVTKCDTLSVRCPSRAFSPRGQSGLTVLNGLLYGVTSRGGANDDGTVFEVHEDGT
jgi:uncharacterized repeat protein (TIGR03803 family)